MTLEELSRREEAEIRAFVHEVADQGELAGRVLDYGCGDSPYRHLVEEHGGVWHGWDRKTYPTNRVGDIGDESLFVRSFDAVLCTQVIQFVPDPAEVLSGIRKDASRLVMTGPTAWPTINDGEDLWRFTLAGIILFVQELGWNVMYARTTWSLPFDGWELPIGWGLVARS